MRVLITTGLFPPEIGGPATYSKLLLDELPKHGLEVDVLPFSKVRDLPNGIRHLAYLGEILNISLKPDIIFAQDPVSVGFSSFLAAKIMRKKFILKIVGDYAWEQGKQRWHIKDGLDKFQQKEYGWQVGLLKKIEKIVAKSADQIIVPSNYLKNIISGWGVDKDKINVVYNAVSKMTEIKVSRKEAQDKIGIKGDILLSAGRLVPWKGFDALVGIIPFLIKKNKNIKLIIIGGGNYKETLERKINQLGLKESVFLTGQVERNKLPLYFKASKIFILNTHYEGLPHLVLEAMQMKRPVITTNIGGNPEVIKNMVSGILTEPDNKKEIIEAIEKTLKDEEFYNRLVRNAHNNLSKFSFENMINKTLKVLYLFTQ